MLETTQKEVTMPRVSIITPFYNPSFDDFERSADSIRNQSNTDFEWVLVDDGSDEYHQFYSDIKLGSNYGPSVARNVGFQISKGDIITYLDIGDELYHDRVEILINLYAKYKVQLTFCGYNIIYPDGQVYPFNHFNHIGVTHHAIDYIQLFQTQNLSVPLGVSHTRKPFVEVGGFQPGIMCGEDGVLWRRMIDRIPANEKMFTDDIAGNYYVSLHGQSRTQRRFEMGGFAINGDLMDNGRYLDASWYQNYKSEEWYD